MTTFKDNTSDMSRALRKEIKISETKQSDIVLMLDAWFCHDRWDWSQRWKGDRYFAKYCIGTVEEAISFKPSDVERAIAAFIVWLRTADNLGSNNIIEVITGFQHDAMTTVENYARVKNHLPIQVRQPKQMMRIIKSLVKTPQERWNKEERQLWSLMIFGLVTLLSKCPTAHNCLIITDHPPRSSEIANVEFRKPEVRDVALQTGMRTFKSSCVTLQ